MVNEFPGLQPILPLRSVLEPDEDARTLHLLTIDERGQPRTLAQSQFTANEWRIINLLLQAYPGYVSYETLLAALRGISLISSRQQLEEARRNRTVRQELKAIRNAIDHIDTKLTTFNFTLLPVHLRGYTLALLKEMGTVLHPL